MTTAAQSLDFVGMTVASAPGTGTTISLGSALSQAGMLSFAGAGGVVGGTYYYQINDGPNMEICYGVLGLTSITRTTIYAASGGVGQTTPINASANAILVSTFNSHTVPQEIGGYLNAFRNGGMQVSQRHSGSWTSGRNTSTSYGIDGWIYTVTTDGATGQNGVTLQQVNAVSGMSSSKALQLTGISTHTSDTLLKQRIESFMCGQFAGQTITVQCKIFNNTGGAITPTLIANHATVVDNFASVAAESANGASMQSCANGALTTVAYTFTASSSANLGLELGLDFGNNLTTTSQSITVSDWDVRLTPGVAAGLNGNPPPAEVRSIGVELPLCMRYYLNSDNTNIGGNVGFSGNTTSGLNYNAYGMFPVPMRVAPSVSAGDVVSATNFPGSPGTLHITTWGFADTRTANVSGGGGTFIDGYTATAEL